MSTSPAKIKENSQNSSGKKKRKLNLVSSVGETSPEFMVTFDQELSHIKESLPVHKYENT